MIYAVFFQDDEAHAAQRAAHMQAHLTFLEKNSASIKAAGPLMDAEDGAAAGGLWLVQAPDKAHVRALVESDPFWPTGLRKSVRLLQWNQVFADGARRL